MKQLFFIIIGLFFITGCGDEQFASVAGDDESIVVGSEEQPQPEEKIQELVIPEVKEKKIGNKKRQKINIVGTVGKNQLRQEVVKTPDVKRTVTHIDVSNRVVVTTETKKVKAEANKKTDSEKSTIVWEKPTEVDLGPELNILFYTNQRAYRTCMDHIRKNHKPFLAGVSNYNWEISFAYYADENQAKLMPLELSNGRPHDVNRHWFKIEEIYTFSKGEYSQDISERLFSNTLKPAIPNHEEHSSANLTPNNGKKAYNPLSGLDKLLSSNKRKTAQTVVLFFGDEFPYNSTEEWNDFYNKHSNVSVVALSTRSSNVSNFLHILEKGHNFNFIANCDIDKTLNLIENQIK